MSDTLEVITPIQSEYVAEHRNAPPTWLWSRLGLAGVMLVSIFMNFYQLGQNGFGNLYYAAAIRSMLDNWHNCSKLLPSSPTSEVMANRSSAFYDWLYGTAVAFCEDASFYYEHGCHWPCFLMSGSYCHDNVRDRQSL